MRRQRRLVRAGALLLPLVALGACTPSGTAAGPVADGASTSDRAAVSTTTSSSPATQPVPTASVAVTGSVTPSATPPATPSVTAAVTPTVTITPGWPKPLAQLQQGDGVWGVYLAVGHSATDAGVARAVQEAAGVGYRPVVGDIACDGGAVEALRLDQYDYWSGAMLYFPTETQARSFAAAYAASVRPTLGVAKVTVGCLD